MIDIMRDCCNLYGLEYIRTPIVEREELFIRGVGEDSDIVSKVPYP